MKIQLFEVAVLVCVFGTAVLADTCTQVLNQEETDENREKILACQLYETSALMTQLGELISNGLEDFMALQGVETDPELSNSIEKRKHEYLRFGKRKHEYLRFGKRKHEYLRFGKRKHEYLRFGK